MCKVVDGMSPEIMNEVFKQRNNPQYNLRHTLQFCVNSIHTVYNDTESALYLVGPEIWEQMPSEIRDKKSLEVFKGYLGYKSISCHKVAYSVQLMNFFI